ncbi:CubicO group peptidase (beta-lactamase class C family) [Chryseobacterium sp. SORGH_AS 447]|uniref:serine hydrolase domain-containing protein n=1 Tax=Chryseobacterium sp. SORGH_AS_0447 TaxID=3041769 RepID=UPI00277F79D3|nr:serine hydrolase [Chryseobacterium sp. SORGH_AS_0447]MDQ1161792.1 CubicO group peptidase (beta-lactamase class C family) [Chryseobacterium sp. SORGH_AS_0447]
MKKIVTVLAAGTSVIAAAIYLSGYGYIFKAAALNLKKGPITPSVDDEEKFPSRPVPNLQAKPWKKHPLYNSNTLSANLLKELKKTRTSSLLIVRQGKLLHEEYWKDHDSTSLMNSFSMAKGILSVLVGCAIDDGYLKSEDQLISTIFPKYAENFYGKHLTFRHLMTMQAGLDWVEEYRHPFAENSKQYFVEDLAEQAFDIDFIEMPGTRYEYQSVAAQLLGLALRKAIDQDLATYLSEKIWKPLGMEFPAKWSTDEKGMEKAFCCIHATTRDFAKIGQLIMQNGRWEDKQLISEDYCKRMLTPTNENDAFCFTVWADDENEIKCRFFYGFLGQFIIMIPQHQMVIVKTGFYNRLDVDNKKRPVQVKLLIDELCKIKQPAAV